MSEDRIPLSVLDLSPVPAGSTARRALLNTIDLARLAERLGCRRYWLAEHHNHPGLASSAPEVMIGHVAAATERIRVGAGGIMLPNHSPLKVAEMFRVLEALHPGRIDLGIGRAPGTDAVTAAALRRTAGVPPADDFPDRIRELLAYAGDGFPPGHPLATVNAEPREVSLPPVWMLGTSRYGASAAAALGVGLAFARYMNPRDAAELTRDYRAAFAPSGGAPRPHLILGVSVVCAEDSARAHALVMSGALWTLRMRQGRPGPIPPPEEATAQPYTERERDRVRRYLRAQVVGDPDEVVAQLRDLAEECAADELMVMTQVHDHRERRRSYELLAEAWAAAGARPAAAA